MTRCYTRCALLLIALAASAETSSAQHGKATPPRSLLTGSGEQTFTMTEIGGQPAIRHSPTKLTLHFNLASAGVDNGCRYRNARMELSRRDRSIRIGVPYSSREQGDPCPPALEAQGARLADALAKVETYEDAGNELRLIGAGQVLARFAPVRSLRPPSALPGSATFWLSVEVGGDATGGDDRLTLNLVGRNVTGRAGSCRYSGHVRHGHGEITFWNLSTVPGACRENSRSRPARRTCARDALRHRAQRTCCPCRGWICACTLPGQRQRRHGNLATGRGWPLFVRRHRSLATRWENEGRQKLRRFVWSHSARRRHGRVQSCSFRGAE